jgi:SPP1 gp7 family putative phage head morphogenesis protein
VNEGWDSRLGFGPSQHRKWQMYENAHVYAAFKNHASMTEMASLLFDEAGNERTFSEFAKAAKPTFEKYNKNWLQSEYRFARNAARSAGQWERLAAKPGLLVYKTIGDGRVRDSHSVLNGTALPASDPFWNSYYPPNGWGCRCYVRHSTTAERKEAEGIPDDIPPMMLNNVGKTGEIFPANHPIRSELNESELADVRDFAVRASGSYIRREAKKQAMNAYGGLNTSMKTITGDIEVEVTKTSIKNAIRGQEAHVLNKLELLTDFENVLQNATHLNRQPVNPNKEAKGVEYYEYFQTTVNGQDYRLVVKKLKWGYQFKTIVPM